MNEKIGILGGSFDLAHDGHLFLSKQAKQLLGLDKVLWLISHHHPFKPHQTPFQTRFDYASALPKPAWIEVSDFERRHETTSSFETLHLLQRLQPSHFVFLMGGDVFCQLPQWHRYRDLMALMPIAVMPRKNSNPRHSPVAARYRAALVPTHLRRTLPFIPAPAIGFMICPMIDVSSSALRNTHHKKDN